MEQTDPTLMRRLKDLLRLSAPDDGSSKAVLNGALGLTAIEAENAFVLPSSKAVGSIPKSSAEEARALKRSGLIEVKPFL